ncbi:hypothetical protein [uncultured Marinococcus sp.]|jgi:hypothetical protein|uniref:hypothetical protein n=1 Tax=uncultured Marinococcus sp. TaxID=487012 RepID=UPI00261A9C31|nr:hypothetical protein [uncultured Marinococcus sp.]
MLGFLIGLLIGAVFSSVIFIIKTRWTMRVQSRQQAVYRLLARERRNRFDVRSMR